MFLGIEIGGTKLQLGVGRGESTELAELVRLDVDRARGAKGILAQITDAAPGLIGKHAVTHIGIGFGGPVDTARGVVIKSHQVEGWDGFALVDWCREKLALPAALGNDSDLGALAEARLGAGKGKSPVMYVNVGTGIGGGLVIDGELYRGNGAGAMEIGHLRLPSFAFAISRDRAGEMEMPHLRAAESPIRGLSAEETVESIAGGPAIAARTFGLAECFLDVPSDPRERDQLLERCQLHMHNHARDAATYLAIQLRQGTRPNAEAVFRAAAAGNLLARQAIDWAIAALGYGLAQAITLLAPAIVVLGGGVSLAGEELFFQPLRKAVQGFVFPPFADIFEIVPAALGEAMVVHGALILAAKHTST